MKQFDQGWWNCFCSYTEEMAGRDYDWEATAEAQLDAAGATKDEIDFVLKKYSIGKKTEKILREYAPSTNPISKKKGAKNG